jgi:hypothetical protein
MDPIEVAAKFAAYTWFRNQPSNRTRGSLEAKQYAESYHYLYYELAYANQAWGRLLIDVIDAREREIETRNRTHRESQVRVPELCGMQ